MEKYSYATYKQENTTTICEKLKRAITTTSPIKAIRFTSNNQVHQETTPITPSPSVPLMTQTLVRDRCTRISSPIPTPLIDRCPRRLVEKIRETDLTVPIIFRQSEIHPNRSGSFGNLSPIRNNNQNSLTNHSKPIPRTNDPKATTSPGQHNVQNSPKNHSKPIPRTNDPKATISLGQDNVQNSPKNHSKPTVQTNNPKADSLPIYGIEHRIPTMPNVEEKSTIAESINGLFTEYIDRVGPKIRSPTMVGVTGMKIDSFNDKVSDFIDRAKHKFHTAPSNHNPSFNEKRVK